ncbi:hypothetical protein HWV62_29424 [Athelia sp. TMB]|nr:hypothetical protein HWV62_29424 [Athelia sp. TMB]
MLVTAESPHQLIAVYNPNSGITPQSVLAWLAQCEDSFKIFNSRNADNPLSVADQIRIMGHAIQEPNMQQWWMQGRDKYTKMTMDDWTAALKERWLSTSGVNDATRACYRLKQGRGDFNSFAAKLSYHRNIVGDIIIPDITYKNLLLFGAHPVLMFDVLALPKFDVCAAELTATELESIMSARWNAIVSTGMLNITVVDTDINSYLPYLAILLWVITLWVLSSVTVVADPVLVLLVVAILLFILAWVRKIVPPKEGTEKEYDYSKFIRCIGLWVLESEVVTEVRVAMGVQQDTEAPAETSKVPVDMEVPVDTEAPAATEVPVDTEAQAATGVRADMGAQEGTAGTEAQRAGQVLEVQEALEAPEDELARAAQLVRAVSLVTEEEPAGVVQLVRVVSLVPEEEPVLALGEQVVESAVWVEAAVWAGQAVWVEQAVWAEQAARVTWAA